MRKDSLGLFDDQPDGDDPAMDGERWWLVQPRELAARHDFDADALLDSIYPEGLADWQLGLVFEAVEECHGEQA